MAHVRPKLFGDGCSNLANTSQPRNKTFRKPFAIYWSYPVTELALLVKLTWFSHKLSGIGEYPNA